ncbi:unnamed protein product [Euphydryas editha]|uniref:Craniofacial development protein 2 n=1 Tax=Euphydryas editha TaxID=104508 RepID=A0AAU9TJP9_EUPED|nr:unnamed protein product [Euphydryas editha]
MGDFNGQIGKQERGEERTVGSHGFGNRSKNGSRLVSFAIENKMRILNSFYKKKSSKKWTWISPNSLYKNEIDYIMSNNAKVFKDVAILNNLNFNTDHRMVRKKYHLKVSNYYKNGKSFYNKKKQTGIVKR